MLSRLEEAFLRQKRFTANAAHELKTPLAILKTGAQVLSSDPSATRKEYQDYAQKNLTTVNRLSVIVDDLLLLASVGEGRNQEREKVYLEPLFEAIQGELSQHLEQRNISLMFQCGEISVMGNDVFIYRAFFNLVENSCKYGRRHGHIWINAEQTGSSVIISVKDDGPGIGAEHLPHIFDAFYRVDKSRSREMGGSGLGLSLVKTMIETEGGQIVVESDGVSGTCFIVTFSV